MCNNAMCLRSWHISSGSIGVLLLIMLPWRSFAAEPPVATVWYGPPMSDRADQQWYPPALSQVRGRVIDYNANELRLAIDSESQSIPSSRVVRIEGALTEELAGPIEEYLAGGDLDTAINDMYSAIKGGPPVWVQRQLTACLAGAAFQAERFKATMELVRSGANAGLPPGHIAHLPIHWRGEALPPAAEAVAASRLNDPLPLVRLVAASWLLPGTQVGQAEQVLRQLAADPADPLIARLADSLLWSTFPPNDSRLEREWIEQRLRLLPISLQAGPLAIVSAKLTAAAERERGLEYALRVGLHHEAPPWVVADVRREAVSLLRALNRPEEADKLQAVFAD